MRIITIFIICLIALSAGARRLRTSRPVTKPIVNAVHAPADSIIIPDSATVRLYGYDKPLRTSRETIFATNNSSDHVNAIALTIIYIDMQGRQLHQAHHRIAIDLPPHQTRKIDFRSWDRQQSFYFHLSKRPRTSATPYTILTSVDTLFIARQNLNL